MTSSPAPLPSESPAPARHRLRIRIINSGFPADPWEDIQIRPLIDGVDLLEDAFEFAEHQPVCGDPRLWLVPEGPLTAREQPHRVQLADQDCGCHGAVMLTIRRDGDTVLWTWQVETEDARPIPESRFDAEQYDAELERAACDFGWEWPAQTVARLLGDTLRSHTSWLERWSCGIDDIWTNCHDHVCIRFSSTEVDADGRLVCVETFSGTLPVINADPVRQAQSLAARFLAGDPRKAEGMHADDQAEKLAHGCENDGYSPHSNGPVPSEYRMPADTVGTAPGEA
ncbi:hypothetical protein [Streptomyces orinoci]|uniref:Uncharacterized protein n=1 Tax=Streptomyces orinoci TaxID=67339 RepID=A0ABV3K1A3_STRON|nr:hypothetical protein [Streptomyces orinoci]